jgi:hypothetical protein
MNDSVEIKPLPGGTVYQLFLPEPVVAALRLTAADGRALFITHENKMQLEWLGQRIWQQYHALKSAFAAGRERLKRKRRMAVILLIIAALIAAFSSAISRLTQVNILYINTFVIAVAVFCCLQLLQYFSKGSLSPDNDPLSGLQISELKKSILRDYSIRD